MKKPGIKIIRIVVEEIVEWKDKYYLATSPDIKWFIAEAESLEEMRRLAPQQMEILLEERLKRITKEKREKEKHQFLKKLIFNISYNVESYLQYA